MNALAERFLKFVDRRSDEECWTWKGCVVSSKRGASIFGPYGRFRMGNVTEYAHRAAYSLFVRQLSGNDQIHHRCGNTQCVNWVNHLEATSPERHILELTPTNIAFIYKQRTHCQRGHPYDEDNTRYNVHGARICRTCHRDNERNRKNRRTA